MAATIVKQRNSPSLVWTHEDGAVRGNRRALLCELDGLLTQLEEINLRGLPLPPRVHVALRRHGIVLGPRQTVAEVIEAIFEVQERYMLRPEVAPAPSQAAPRRELEDLRRRIAV